ncbi:unnamed protein product [Acanthoscelides obtectus]|uniref:Uncharacterized protein n=1 Tax=Acanthoscelides obtectus TaxID=200917 RepID=A0A9P0KRF4_ACAOB|nr:unnamed protein product [Acanthoscelides obtectus]CAK1664411.1 hypothetical protein AOBTE_LOCUS24248 [Acanthoscelides obtectus]
MNNWLQNYENTWITNYKNTWITSYKIANTTTMVYMPTQHVGTYKP